MQEARGEATPAVGPRALYRISSRAAKEPNRAKQRPLLNWERRTHTHTDIGMKRTGSAERRLHVANGTTFMVRAELDPVAGGAGVWFCWRVQAGSTRDDELLPVFLEKRSVQETERLQKIWGTKMGSRTNLLRWERL